MALQIGQRVMCDSEPNLGMGEIIAIDDDARTVDIMFVAVDQKRRYRLGIAPLRRVSLHPGQQVTSKAGQRFCIETVREEGGLFHYSGEGVDLCETDLEYKIPLGGAVDRLRAKNLGVREELELHEQAWKVRASMLGTRTRGLGGSRVSLLAHQLYVAERVSSLVFPRVLLADQVGLGKTIEAGMIFSALRSLGRADRVLIVVPDSLVHQWLAELARRFNEIFHLVTKEAVAETTPFSFARCLTTWGALRTGLYSEACQADWDLVIIDEAHHLREGQFAHKVAEMLAERAAGLLLLTGTPARNGAQSEFTLLKLVDPQRYSDFEQYSEQRRDLQAISAIARELNAGGEAYEATQHEEALQRLLAHLPHDEGVQLLVQRFREGDPEAKRALIEALIDRHGPGRVIFRNRRERLQNLFPGRHVEFVPLRVEKQEGQKVVDPRLQWIVDFLITHKGEKVVVISSKAEVVVALHHQLRQGWSIESAVFYEEMPIVERDRQAVWFAAKDGAQVLICSEIGSEGRNFQFAHNMIFWDIPIQPDIVEQRIGRLDRIGQTQVVNVYALYLVGTAVELLLRWHVSMGSFEGPVENGSEIIAQVDLRQNLNAEGFAAMMDKSKKLLEHYKAKARENVDYLVDLNSFNHERGAELQREVVQTEKECQLENFMIRLLEVFGIIASDTRRSGVWVLQGTFNQRQELLSGWENEMLVTFDRNVALTYEDVNYLTPDHPLVNSAISALLDSGSGCASALCWRGAGQSGLLVQCLYLLEAVGPTSLELGRYLPPCTSLVSLQLNGKPYEGNIADVAQMQPMSDLLLDTVLKKLGARLDKLVEVAAKQVQTQFEDNVTAAVARAEAQLSMEITRLHELSRVNPMVSVAEIEQVETKKAAVLQALSHARPRLDGLRLIIMEA